MLSLAALRYRDILAAHGGPVLSIESGLFPVRGQLVTLANVRLKPGLTWKSPLTLFSDADGTGTDPVASVARHKAISEAMERWAFYALVKSEQAQEFAFDVDPSTTGMSAFPGFRRRQARRSAVLEAIERFSLISWWDGHVEALQCETDWPGVSAVAIDGPFGGIAVIAYAKTEWGGYVYGHAAEESFGSACERAVGELARHEWILRSRWLTAVGGTATEPSNLFERRCLFFATDEGHELFQERAARRPTGAKPRPEIICDRDIPGPWDVYATVWRFALRPPSDGYLRCGENYFFL
jgi:hypothetical protein